MEDEERVEKRKIKNKNKMAQELLAKARIEPRERTFAACSAASCQQLFTVSIRIKHS